MLPGFINMLLEDVALILDYCRVLPVHWNHFLHVHISDA